VNKVATKAELRFFLDQSTALHPAQKRRLRAAFPSHVTQSGEFIVTGDRYRSQLRNQEDVLERLAEMIRSIRRPRKRRVATKPTRASRKRRVDEKRKRGELKKQRRRPSSD
jgi:ribosome-associated protein